MVGKIDTLRSRREKTEREREWSAVGKIDRLRSRRKGGKGKDGEAAAVLLVE